MFVRRYSLFHLLWSLLFLQTFCCSALSLCGFHTQRTSRYKICRRRDVTYCDSIRTNYVTAERTLPRKYLHNVFLHGLLFLRRIISTSTRCSHCRTLRQNLFYPIMSPLACVARCRVEIEGTCPLRAKGNAMARANQVSSLPSRGGASPYASSQLKVNVTGTCPVIG